MRLNQIQSSSVKVRSLVLAALVALFSQFVAAIPAHAATEFAVCTTGDVIIIDNVVTGNNDCAGTVTLPNTVIAIGVNAFFGNTGLVGIDLGTGVQSLAAGAFEVATALASITIPDNVISIGSSAFYGDSNLEAVSLGSSLQSIEQHAFEFNTKLISVSLPDSLILLGDSAFYGDTSLTSLTLGRGLVEIPAHAFQSCPMLGAVVIPNTVAQIGISAFFEDFYLSLSTENRSNDALIGWNTDAYIQGNDIADIDLANYLANHGGPKLYVHWASTSVGFPTDVNCTTGSFQISNATVVGNTDCAGAVVVPSGVTRIGTEAFRGNTMITSVTMPDTVDSIGNSAFSNATTLSSVHLGPSVRTIESGAFEGCELLTTINFPSSLRVIHSMAFFADINLTHITLNDGLDGIAASAFESTGLTSVTIPDSVQHIGVHAFAILDSLTSVTIGSGLDQIEFCTFCFDTSLVNVTVGSGVNLIQRGAFVGDKFINVTTQATSGHIFGSWNTDLGVVVNSPDLGWYLNTFPNANLFAHRANDISGLLTTFASGDGAGTPPDTLSGVVNSAPGLGNMVAPAGKHLSGWACSSADGQEINALVGHAITPTADTTCVAQWAATTIKATASKKPTISGVNVKSSKNGKYKLYANKGTWVGTPNPVITYKWYACTRTISVARATAPATCKVIARATAATLALKPAQKGKYISVAVTATSAGSTPTTWLSKTSAKVK